MTVQAHQQFMTMVPIGVDITGQNQIVAFHMEQRLLKKIALHFLINSGRYSIGFTNLKLQF